jgi:aminoglycoside 6'-N-acetyltransferase
MPAYAFRRMTESDLPLLEQWLQLPDWRLWWGEPEEELASLAADLQEPGMRLWIVEHDDTPFAFLQDYRVHAWADHPYRDLLPDGACGIDQSIGIPDMLGRGHGSAFIAQHAERLLADGEPCIVTDPHPDNVRAIRAYEKAGFTRLCELDEAGDWGPVLLMVRRA